VKWRRRVRGRGKGVKKNRGGGGVERGVGKGVEEELGGAGSGEENWMALGVREQGNVEEECRAAGEEEGRTRKKEWGTGRGGGGEQE